MNIGDKVSPKTVAGLWLVDVLVNGQGWAGAGALILIK
jgi:hypothetical protein